MRRAGVQVILVALLVTMAGCGATEQGTLTPTKQPTIEPTPTPPPTTTPMQESEPPKQEINGVTFYNMTAKKAEKINHTINHSFEKLPKNRSERLNRTSRVASRICTNSGKIDAEAVTALGESDRDLRRVKHVAQTIKNNFNSNIQPERVKRVIRITSKAGKYATFIGSYNQFYEASCAVERDDPESVKQFYLATAALGAEMALMQYSVPYKVASKTTRVASHTKTFRMVQAKAGDDGLRMLMSETHWLVRGGVDGLNSFLVQQSAEHNVSVNRTELSEDRLKERLKEIHGKEILRESASAAGKKVNETKSRAERVINKSSLDEKIACLKVLSEDAGVLSSLPAKVAEILSDGEVHSEEIDQLSPEQRSKFVDCLERKQN